MKLIDKMQIELDNLKESHNYRKVRTFDGEYLNFSSNDYLGIAQDNELKEEFYKTYENLSLSSSSSRLITGSYSTIMELENELKKIYKKDALVFNSGFDANECVIETIFKKDTLIISDKYNHASIYSGILATESKLVRYPHLDYDFLEKILIKYKDEYENILVISETIYSMDGDCCNLDKLIDLKKIYKFKLMIDEAHSYGVYGYGMGYSLGVVHDIDYLVIPLGKAGGSIGAYLLTDLVSKEYIINKGKKFIYSTALPPVNISWNLFILRKMPELLNKEKKLRDLTSYTHKLLKNSWIKTESTTHIISIIIGDNRKTDEICSRLLEKGLLLFPIKKPTVPEGSSRIRMSLNSKLEYEDIDMAVKEIVHELNNIF